jgi:hypothetical protein
MNQILIRARILKIKRGYIKPQKTKKFLRFTNKNQRLSQTAATKKL